MLIGITGRKQHGKDTFANAIRSYVPELKPTILHFASALKDMSMSIFHLTHEQVYGEEKEVPFDRPIEMDDYLTEMQRETGLKLAPAGKVAEHARHILQYFGTDYVRKAAPNYWVELLVERCQSCKDVLVPDTRFPNEAEALRAIGGKIIKVVRIDLDAPVDTHDSESSIDLITPDLYVGARTGDLSLIQQIAALVATGEFETACAFDYRRLLNESREHLPREFLEYYC